jgi:hypothetical protein
MPKVNSGELFERTFAVYMESELHVSATERRCRLRGNTAVSPYECDVHGIIRSRGWRLLQIVGFVTLIAATWAVVDPEAYAAIGSLGREIERVLGPRVAGLGLLILGGCGMLLGTVGNHRHTRHIWVECKDRRATVKRVDINKLERSAADVRANRNADWRPNELWFASSSPYDQDAIAMARQYGMRCFELVEDEFVER